MTMPPLLNPKPGRFLHLIPDDKFIDAARDIFEDVAEGKHDYLVIGDPGKLHYVRTFDPARMELGTALRATFLSQLAHYSAVFVHFLSDSARIVVAEAPIEANFVWLGWGADYHHLINSSDSILLPQTRALTSEIESSSHRDTTLNHLLARISSAITRPDQALQRARLNRIRRNIGPGSAAESNLLNRFRGVAMPIVEDYLAMAERRPEIDVPFVDWNYWTDGLVPDGVDLAPTGNNVLLGNSATPTNNHLEALERISLSLTSGRKVICPLSYGDVHYADAIEKAGTAMFGSDFVPLRNYLDTVEYSEVIRSCSTVVMNHIRQQAMGNIILALCNGARVFLNQKSPVIPAMQRIGINVHALDAEHFPGRTQERPDDSELGDIRRKIGAHYGRPAINLRTRAMLDRFSANPRTAPAASRP